MKEEEIDYNFYWGWISTIEKMRNDLDKLTELGTTHIIIDSRDSPYGLETGHYAMRITDDSDDDNAIQSAIEILNKEIANLKCLRKVLQISALNYYGELKPNRCKNIAHIDYDINWTRFCDIGKIAEDVNKLTELEATHIVAYPYETQYGIETYHFPFCTSVDISERNIEDCMIDVLNRRISKLECNLKTK